MTGDTGGGADTPQPVSAFAELLSAASFGDATGFEHRLFAKLQDSYQFAYDAYGANAAGVYWAEQRHQRVRFDHIARLFRAHPRDQPWTVADLGCSYGALFEDLVRRRLATPGLRYIGYDIFAPMLSEARARITDPRARFEFGHRVDRPVDYAVASGTFSMKMDEDPARFRRFALDGLGAMAAQVRLGFAVNMLDLARWQPDSDLFFDDPEPYRRRFTTASGWNTKLLSHPKNGFWTLLAWRRPL